MNRKASIVDSIFMVVILFAVAISFVLGYKIYDTMNTHIQGADTIPDSGKAVSQNFYDSYVTIFDYGFLFILIILFLATVVLGAMVDTHPVLYFISAFLTLIVIILAAIFANTYDEFRDTSSISAYASQFVIIGFVMEHFVSIITVFILVVAGITYMRVRS